MKISKRKTPTLEMLSDGDISKMKYYPNDIDFIINYTNVINALWFDNYKKFKNEISYITKPFEDAVIKSEKKLKVLLKDLFTNGFYFNGTHITNNCIYCFSIKVEKGSDNVDSNIIVFSRNNAIMLLSTKKNIWYSKWYVESNHITFIESQNNEYYQNKIFFRILFIEAFKKYAKVETKYLPPKSKTKEIHCKYVNDTSLGITILDSKWFTNLVQSEGFKVRGHFRLQPKKENGKWTRELIYIEDFEKKGYTSKSKITQTTPSHSPTE
jgi:hypothetical protein